MDFTESLSSDLIAYHILLCDRSIHTVILCRQVSKYLKNIVDDIFTRTEESVNISRFKDVKEIVENICTGYRHIRLKSIFNSNLSTYHYIVNYTYKTFYNYHQEDQYGGESLGITFYDGTSINIFKYSKHSPITIHLGSYMSCSYKLNNMQDSFPENFLDGTFLTKSQIFECKTKPLRFS